MSKIDDLSKDILIETIIGNIAGSRFELSNCETGKDFELLHSVCRFTDDSVMTLAVAIKDKKEYDTGM